MTELLVPTARVSCVSLSPSLSLCTITVLSYTHAMANLPDAMSDIALRARAKARSRQTPLFLQSQGSVWPATKTPILLFTLYGAAIYLLSLAGLGQSRTRCCPLDAASARGLTGHGHLCVCLAILQLQTSARAHPP